MTMPGAPGSGRGAPMFEQVAQDAIAATRPRPQQWPPPEPVYGQPPAPLTDEEKKLAAQAERAALICRLCGAVHAMPNTAACPRLASFELDADGKVKAGTFFSGTKWQDRVVLAEELHEEDGDAG